MGVSIKLGVLFGGPACGACMRGHTIWVNIKCVSFLVPYMPKYSFRYDFEAYSRHMML